MSNGKLEAVLLLGDAFVEEMQKQNREQKPVMTGTPKVTWWKRDCDGQRVTASKRRKKGSAAVSTSLCASITTSSCAVEQDADFNMKRLEDLLSTSESDVQDLQPQLESKTKRGPTMLATSEATEPGQHAVG